MSIATNGNTNELEAETIRLISWRLLPYLMLLFLVAFIDRSNVSVAALRMNEDLGLSPSVFGLGAGLFFISYTIFEVPSNMIMHRVGARIWIARILITWGIIASAMAAVVGPHSFYALRLLLGAAEAGLYPGVLLYISLWFPKRAQAFALAIFSCSGPLALSIGNVLSTILMEGFHEFAGFRGWQWMYFLEGIPAVILGFVTFFILPNGPADARWLPEPNRKWIIDQLSKERAQTSKEGERNPASVMLDKDVLIYSFIFFCLVQGNLGLSIWLPQIIRQVGAASVYESGFLSALPYICAVPVMILVARHSDRTQERQLHVMFSAFAGALGLVLSTLTGNFALSLVALCFAAAGILSALGTFFSMPMGFLSGAVAAVALAFINAVGNFGGFVGPYMIGLVKDATQGFAAGLWVLAAFLAVGGLLALRQPSGRFAKSASLRGRDTATTNSAMVK